MGASMTTTTQYNKVFDRIVLSVSIFMMNIESYVGTQATKTSVVKGFKSYFSINFYLRLLAKFFLYCSCKSFGVFPRQPFILTFFTAVSSVFCLCWLKVSNIAAIFTGNRNFITCVPLVKTWQRTKTFTTIFTRLNDEIRRTVETFCSYLRMPVFLSATDRAKSLSFQIGIESFFTKFTRFFHKIMIDQLLDNEQVKHFKLVSIGG